MQFEPCDWHDLNPKDSHLAGPAFWPAGTLWPVCGQCDSPLSFIGQVRLDRAAIPGAQAGDLLTFHYCLRCRPDVPEQASAYRLRLHRNVDRSDVTPCLPPPSEAPVWRPTPSRIRLVPRRSVPHWEDAEPELEHLGLDYNGWRVYGNTVEQFGLAPAERSQLGGYPEWLFVSEWPTCHECGTRMVLIWKLASTRSVSLFWGPGGRVLIFACPCRCSDHALALVHQYCT